MRLLYLPNSYSQQRQREKKANIYPVKMAMECEYHRRKGDIVYWGSAPKRFDKIISRPEGIDFLKLPAPDRVFTNAKNYTSGNYKYLPGTHMQVADGCWWGNCTFCVEKGSEYKVRPVDSVIEEIKECKRLGFREIFDDSGTFPTGRWLDEFLRKFNSDRGIHFSCNMRLVDVDYRRMYEKGFRMLLFGVESANDKTLNRIKKGVKSEEIIPTIKKASEAGLEPHVAVMFGFPWEGDDDSINTLRLVHYLLKKGYAKTAQASFYRTSEQSNESQRKFVRKIYSVASSPTFWLNKIRDIKNVDDLKYLWTAIKKGLYDRCNFN